MKLPDDIIQKIENEYNEWYSIQYGSNSDDERKKLGQFYTPPTLTVKMLEKFENLNGAILDPTCGAGGLIAAAVIAGANPRKCYGIELDPAIVEIARNRLSRLGVPSFNIKQGDALKDESYEFSDEYANDEFIEVRIKKEGVSEFEIQLVINSLNKTSFSKFKMNLLDNDTTLTKKATALWILLNNLIKKGYLFCGGKDLEASLKIFNAIFRKYLKKKMTLPEKKIFVN